MPNGNDDGSVHWPHYDDVHVDPCHAMPCPKLQRVLTQDLCPAPYLLRTASCPIQCEGQSGNQFPMQNPHREQSKALHILKLQRRGLQQ